MTKGIIVRLLLREQAGLAAPDFAGMIRDKAGGICFSFGEDLLRNRQGGVEITVEV